MRKSLYFCTFWHRLIVRGDFVNRRSSVRARLLAPAFVPLGRDYGLAGQILHPFLNRDRTPLWGEGVVWTGVSTEGNRTDIPHNG